MFKILSTYICWEKCIKCNIWRVAVRPSYIWDARFLKVKPPSPHMWYSVVDRKRISRAGQPKTDASMLGRRKGFFFHSNPSWSPNLLFGEDQMAAASGIKEQKRWALVTLSQKPSFCKQCVLTCRDGQISHLKRNVLRVSILPEFLWALRVGRPCDGVRSGELMACTLVYLNDGLWRYSVKWLKAVVINGAVEEPRETLRSCRTCRDVVKNRVHFTPGHHTSRQRPSDLQVMEFSLL
jgi:hypothetical protein